MNRMLFKNRVSKAVLTLAFAAVCATNALAQNTSQSSAGVLSPPPEITNIVSIDGHNTLLVESRNPSAPDEPKQYSLVVPRHIYSGALARIFGGSIISTEALVIPESARRANFGAPGGVSGIGNNGNSNNNSFNNSNNNGGFNSGNNNGNNNGNSNTFNRSFPSYSPQIAVNNLNQLNQVLGLLDRPSRQAQIGISQ